MVTRPKGMAGGARVRPPSVPAIRRPQRVSSRCSRCLATARGGEGESWEDYLTKEERPDGSKHFRFVGGLKSGRQAKSRRRVHFVGIGGSGLSNLAKLAMARGWLVTGSDISESDKLESLREGGALVDVGHREDNVLEKEGADCLPDAIVVSSAVSADNVEVRCALRYNIPLYKRGAWLGRVTSGHDLVSVAGTHGKTTTTAMVAEVLGSLCPEAEGGVTAIVGGDVASWEDGGAVVGEGQTFVLEADEYDRTFLGLRSRHAIVTNVELDHLDVYESEEEILQAFEEFLENVSQSGAVVMCGDDLGCRALLERREIGPEGGEEGAGPSVQTYGYGGGNDWRATDVRVEGGGVTSFKVERRGEVILEQCRLPLLGRHNVLNALGAIALAAAVGPGGRSDRECAEEAAQVLASFRGVERRCQVLGRKGSRVVVSDYAHHPTEVQATLEAVSEHYAEADLVVVFEPHTLSRLAYFFKEFAEVLQQCPRVFLTKVHEPVKTYISAKVKNAIAEDLEGEIGRDTATYIPGDEDLIAEVARAAQRGGGDTVVLVLGAGRSHALAHGILEAL